MGTYDVAQICLNGHVITARAKSAERRQEFCTECGEKTITSCQNCNARIKGHYDVPGVIAIGVKYNKPKYCEKCGHPFPWTKRQLDAAKELVELAEVLNANEKNELKTAISELVKDTPQAVVAQVKYQKYVAKAGSELANGLKSILVNILSEVAKKAIWG